MTDLQFTHLAFMLTVLAEDKLSPWVYRLMLLPQALCLILLSIMELLKWLR